MLDIFTIIIVVDEYHGFPLSWTQTFKHPVFKSPNLSSLRAGNQIAHPYRIKDKLIILYISAQFLKREMDTNF
jgi:hypothetical protein